MGQILSWIRGPRDPPVLQDVAVDQQSQPGQATPKPAAQVSVVKPSRVETAPVSQIRGSSTLPPALAGTTGHGTPSASISSGTLTASAATTKVESPKDKAKASAAATNVAGSGKMDKTTPAQTKAPPVDPFDALASILPSADSVAKPEPEYTGPEVIETGVVVEDDPKCGEREDTLPPDYRLEDMPAAPADWKPPDAPKPLSTDEALDSLSAGFMTSTIPKGASKTQNMNTLESACSASAGKANYANPPADKKAKMEKGSDYVAGIKPTPFKKASPPSEKKGLVDFSLNAALDTKPDAKTKAKTTSMSPDAMSALGDLLPASTPKPEPPKLRPEDIVSEAKHKEEDAVLVGEREDTIHPDYRFNKEELEKLPAPKPEPSMGTSEAFDILSEDFMTSTTDGGVQAPMVTPRPPIQKGPPPVADDFSLEAGLSASSVKMQKLESSALPPNKAKGKDTSFQLDTSDKSLQDGSVPSGALDALGDLLPVDEPKPKSPEIKPEDIVWEKKYKEKEAVLVGEREDTIPEEYRFNKEVLEKLPAPKPEPTIGTGDALDFLSEDFTDSTMTSSASAPVVCVPPPSTKVIVDDLSALDVLSGDFASSKSAPATHASAPPPMQQKTVCPSSQDLKTVKGEPMPMDALSALSDSLPADVPKPKLPELRPEDIVSEDKHNEEDAVLVGEREDTIPEEYRFNKEELEKLPAPKPEPTISTGNALDFLSTSLTSQEAPSVNAPVVASSASLAQSSADAALDALSGDFACKAAAPTVSASLPADTDAELQLSPGADNALDALSDTLKDIKPVPQPAPLPPKNIVNEKKAVEERLIKMGERDDTLPPEFRPTEEDLQNMGEAANKEALKPTPSLDDKTALELLSQDFSAGPDPEASSTTCAATATLQSSVSDPESAKTMPGPVLETLSETLLPDTPEFKSLPKKPKEKRAEVPSAADLLPAPQSSDVLPSTTKKGGKR